MESPWAAAYDQFPSNAGGGGERVLWTAVAHIQHEHTDIICVVYSGDVDASKKEIIEKVKVRYSPRFHLDSLPT